MLTMKQVDDRLRRIGKRYTAINSDVQDMAVAIVSHANDTGDCDRARKLVRALPARMRSLLTNWFAEVSPINVTIGKTVVDDKVSLRQEGKKNYMPFDIERAKANLWFEDPFKKEPVAELNTLKTYYDSAERLFERMEKDTQDDAGKVNEADIERVKALRAALRAAFVEFAQGNPIAETNEAEEQVEQEPAEAMVRAAA